MNEKPIASPAWGGWRWALAGLSVLGLGLSSYLGWHSVTGAPAIGCGAGSSCDDVLNSSWSSIAGVVPVSGLAAGVYLALLAGSFFTGRDNEPAVRRLAWRAMLVLVGAAAGSAVWFIAVQKWIIGAFCPYCMATHVTSLLLAALVIWRAARERAEVSPEVAVRTRSSKPKLDATPAIRAPQADDRPFFLWPALGLLLAGAMAIGQFAYTPPSVSRGGVSEAADTVTTFDPKNVPLLGSRDAPYVVELLFDYNCPHCQQLHGMLEEAVARYGGKLAFVLCPAPLNTACNPYITGDSDAFKDSCDLAWLGLTVWVANREAFAEFDRWMFTAESGHLWRPKKFDAALAKAIELVGRPKFEAAQRDPWIERYLQTSVRVYGTNGTGAVPKLVYGARWVTPQPRTTDDLLQILQIGLGTPKP